MLLALTDQHLQPGTFHVRQRKRGTHRAEEKVVFVQLTDICACS